jgi:hypothetical protein
MSTVEHIGQVPRNNRVGNRNVHPSEKSGNLHKKTISTLQFYQFLQNSGNQEMPPFGETRCVPNIWHVLSIIRAWHLKTIKVPSFTLISFSRQPRYPGDPAYDVKFTKLTMASPTF